MISYTSNDLTLFTCEIFGRARNHGKSCQNRVRPLVGESFIVRYQKLDLEYLGFTLSVESCPIW